MTVKQGDNALGSIRVSICVSVHLCALSQWAITLTFEAKDDYYQSIEFVFLSVIRGLLQII